MTKPTSQKMRAQSRRPAVAELYLSGWRQSAIAQKFGVSQGTISNDLKAIRKDWVKSAVRDFDQLKEQELQRVDNLEREGWEQYEASKAPKETTTKKVSSTGGGSPRSEIVTREEVRQGDPKYLSIVQWCIEQRCKILGIYAAAKSQNLNIDMSSLTDSQLQRITDGEDLLGVLTNPT